MLALAALAGCAVGPDYMRPDAPVPARYKEAAAVVPSMGWKPGTPQDAASRGAWWAIYGDPVLDGLERQVDISNQNLKSAEAAYRQAQAIVGEGRAGFFPTVTLNAAAQRSGQGGVTGGGARGSSSTTRSPSDVTLYSLSGTASWAPDLWGRIRRTVESDIATAQASAADLASARLSAQATLAIDYFELRAADELQRLLEAAVAAYTQALQITENRYRQGVAALSDVASARSQLDTTSAQAIGVGVQRAQLEHAIAVLIGQPAADFSIAPAPLAMAAPVTPPGLPSTLLERRPDIAAAERLVAAANAQIGVAQSAWFPDLTLSASAGFSATDLARLLSVSNSLWSLGPQLAATLFDGGLRSAQVAAARAGYDARVASYRETVLAGFQQVEDELAALRILADQAAAQDIAVRSADEAERLLFNQYKAGTVAYTNVITAQTTALTNRQNALTILENRLVASVALIEALGGGWGATDLPSPAQVEAGAPSIFP